MAPLLVFPLTKEAMWTAPGRIDKLRSAIFTALTALALLMTRRGSRLPHEPGTARSGPPLSDETLNRLLSRMRAEYAPEQPGRSPRRWFLGHRNCRGLPH